MALIAGSCLSNAFGVCTQSSNGARMCAGSDFDATMDKSIYTSTEFPVVLMSGAPGKVLSLTVLDTLSQQKVVDIIQIGPNGTARYSFGITTYSYGKYYVEVSDGISTINLDFSVGATSSQENNTQLQNADQATLLIYTNVPWKGSIGTLSNSTLLNGITDTRYSFTCNYDDKYLVTLQSAGYAGRGVSIWTVADLIQGGKMLDMQVNQFANGIITLSGQCHVAKFPMSNTGLVSFTTDKTNYRYGEPIQISGYILPELQRSYVLSSTILNSDGMAIRKDSTAFGTLNTFTFYVPTSGGLWKPGEYRILVEIDKSVAQTDITIYPVDQKQSDATKSGNYIPPWVKNIAKWWGQGKVSDLEFKQTIQYLIQQGIIKVPYFYSPNISTQSLLGWMKSSAISWGSGHMSDDEFVNVLKYLNFR